MLRSLKHTVWGGGWGELKLKYCTWGTICKNNAMQLPVNLENSAMATGLEKVSFQSNIKEGQCQTMFKLPHNCAISQASKAMLNILQAALQQYMSRELPEVQAQF